MRSIPNRRTPESQGYEDASAFDEQAGRTAVKRSAFEEAREAAGLSAEIKPYSILNELRQV